MITKTVIKVCKYTILVTMVFSFIYALICYAIGSEHVKNMTREVARHAYTFNYISPADLKVYTDELEAKYPMASGTVVKIETIGTNKNMVGNTPTVQEGTIFKVTVTANVSIVSVRGSRVNIPATKTYTATTTYYYRGLN